MNSLVNCKIFFIKHTRQLITIMSSVKCHLKSERGGGGWNEWWWKQWMGCWWADVFWPNKRWTEWGKHLGLCEASTLWWRFTLNPFVVLGSMCVRCLNLPEITVGVNYPKSGGFNPLLFSFHRLLTPKHPQGELVDPGLKHRSKLSVYEPSLI